ncbi:MAG: HEAT repeat domain-containing protein [Planctomycetota bacterium]
MRERRFPMATVLLLLRGLVLAAFAVLPGAAPDGGGDVRELLVRIARDRDGVDPSVFEGIAAHGDLDSLRALLRGLDYLKDERVLAAAYRAFRLYAGRDEETVEAAVEFLADAAEKAKPVSLRPVALETLILLGDAALRPLERVVKRHEDPALRRTAADALAVWLARRGDAEGLELVLANASLRLDAGLLYLGIPAAEARGLAQKAHRDVVRDLLAARAGGEGGELLAKHMLAPDTPREWKLLLIGIFVPRPDPATTELLAKLLTDDDSAVVYHVLDLLVERDDWREACDKLSPLIRNPDRAVRRAAVVAMGRLLVTDAKWREEALALGAHRDPAVRMGAASALARMRTVEAIPVLHGLLADNDWSVRAEALQQVTELRRKDSIPLLIERLAVETPRLRPDVHAALRILTGYDHGTLAGTWRQWWAAEGEAFAVPSYAEAAAAEDARRQAGTVGGTKSEHFYGVQIQSERVCFILDISGSMELPMGSRGDDVTSSRPGAPTRMETAKKELSKVLRALPDDTLFNVIFFESRVVALSETLERMSRGMRQRSLRFVDEQFAMGSTALYPAIQLAFSDPLVDTIYLLSDGAPTAGEITDIAVIREEVKRWNSARHVRIHGVTVGQDSDLLRWLTADTGGRYVRID